MCCICIPWIRCTPATPQGMLIPTTHAAAAPCVFDIFIYFSFCLCASVCVSVCLYLPPLLSPFLSVHHCSFPASLCLGVCVFPCLCICLFDFSMVFIAVVWSLRCAASLLLCVCWFAATSNQETPDKFSLLALIRVLLNRLF